MHNENCTAPICVGDPNKNYADEVLWYPGEGICNKSPMQKFQRNQRRINKLVAKGTFKNLDRAFTARELAAIGRITNSTKGRRPEHPEFQ